MIASLFALLLASSQPAPTEDPVVTEAEMQVEADIAIDAAADADAAAAEAEAAAQQAEAAANAAAADALADAEPEEEIVCRRRLVPAEGVGRRHRTVRDCRPASEWPSSRQGRRGN